MSVTFASPPAAETETAEQRFVIDGIRWDALCDDLAMRSTSISVSGLIYCDGRLTLVGKSREHDWHAERLGELVKPSHGH